MTIYRKKNKSGKLTKTWYYDFKYKKRRYSGSTGKTIQLEAKIFELQVKENAKERYKLVVTDGASDIGLMTAIELAIEKPSKISRSKTKNKRKRQIWIDFITWLNSLYTQVEFLHQVTPSMAEAYIQEISANGKFIKCIKHKNKKGYNSQKKLSTSSINAYHKEIEWVFKKLTVDAGLLRNPFSHIEKKKTNKVKRIAYTDKEITLIQNKIEDFPFCKFLFYVATGTGMRMGNICMLNWSDVDIEKKLIQCANRKTGGKLTIPILPDLYEFLKNRTPKAEGYISPIHAETYLRDSASVSSTFTKFLNSIGIKTKVKVDGYARCRNIKGIHAMRHTFIYRAMIANIPLNIIQCIVGHVDSDITMMYADHVMAQDAQKAMEGFTVSGENNSDIQSSCKDKLKQNDLVQGLAEKLSKLSPEKQKQLLEFVS